MPIRIANPTPGEWDVLVHKSHQTSVYVLPEWLALHPVHVLGAYDGDEIVAGMVLADGHLPLGFTPYQGLLLTRREQPLVVKALLQEAEKLGRVSSWNAPSLVDARPFVWRYHDSRELWLSDIRYHAFLTSKCRPFADFPDIAYEPTHLRPGDISKFTERTAFTTGEKELLEKIVTFESVACYVGADSAIIIATDLQGRGYLIVGWGPNWQGLTFNVCRNYESTDLGGVNSSESNRRLRSFGFILRTSYGFLHRPKK